MQKSPEKFRFGVAASVVFYPEAPAGDTCKQIGSGFNAIEGQFWAR